MKRKIKICFFMPMAYALFKKTNNSFGGAEINLYFLAKELAKNKEFEIEFLVADYEQNKYEYIDNVKLIKLKYTKESKLSIYQKIMKRFYLYWNLSTNKSDILITSGADVLFKIYFFSKFLSSKKIILRMPHDRYCNTQHYKNYPLKSKLYKYALKRIDQIVTQSINQNELLLKYENINSIIIKNGFPMYNLTKNQNKESILWVARCIDWKRPFLFIELARQLPDENFILIAPGNGQLKNQIINSISTINNITLLNKVNFFEIHKYYESSKCFVNTSTMEGFPNTFIQSCLAGTPILTFNVNPENMINTYQIGCHCKDDIDTAINFIKNLNQNKLNSYKKNCNQYILDNHCIIDKAKQYEAIINKLM